MERCIITGIGWKRNCHRIENPRHYQIKKKAPDSGRWWWIKHLALSLMLIFIYHIYNFQYVINTIKKQSKGPNIITFI